MKFGKYACIGLGLDIFDWMILGMIPGLGDAVDVVTLGFWYAKIGPLGLASAIELVPVADVLPTNVILGMVADGLAAKAKEREAPRVAAFEQP